MRVLVTGGTGYIGSHTIVELLEADHTVVAIDNLVNSSAKSLERVERITGRRVEFQLVDLLNKEALNLLFRRQGPFDAVIHFAGLKAVGESVEKPLLYYENNLTGTLNLLVTMSNHGCHNLVFSSSATVYAGANNLVNPVTESSPLGCTNAYGRTKLMVEKMLRDICYDPLWNVTILRYFNPVGAHPSGLIGEDPSGPPNNLMPYVSQVASGRRACLQVYGDDWDTPDGTGVRDYIHVVDLAKGHVAALSHLGGCLTYNLGTGCGHSVMDLVEGMRKASGHPIPLRVVGRRSGDVATLYSDPTLANRELQWFAQHSLEDMCRPEGY